MAMAQTMKSQRELFM